VAPISTGRFGITGMRGRIWNQAAKQSGYRTPGFIARLLYSIARTQPGSLLEITLGDNVVFSNVSCCNATTGYDMASGLGSPLADQIVNYVPH
jgi:hypothetical protein